MNGLQLIVDGNRIHVPTIHSERQKKSDINDSVHSEKMWGDLIGVHIHLNQNVRNHLMCHSDLRTQVEGTATLSPPLHTDTQRLHYGCYRRP